MRKIRPIWDTFLQNVSRSPHSRAISCADTGDCKTYFQLKRDANEWQKLIAFCDVSFVVFLGEPNLSQISIVLACAAEEVCFVPLDSSMSDTLLTQILENIGMPSLVFQNKIVKINLPKLKKKKFGVKTLNIFHPKKQIDLDIKIPFLITHTSGSTGAPKAIYFYQQTKKKRTEQSIKLFNIKQTDIVLTNPQVRPENLKVWGSVFMSFMCKSKGVKYKLLIEKCDEDANANISEHEKIQYHVY